MLNLLFGPPRKLGDFFGGFGWFSPYFHTRRRTQAGPVVDEELALTYAAVTCATRVICEAAAMLPLCMYRHLSDGGREEAVGHRVYDLLRLQPNDRMGWTPFREGRTSHQVNWGNGFAEIERNRAGEPVALHPIHACRVRPTLPGDPNAGFNDEYAQYSVMNNAGQRIPMNASELLHVPGMLSDDGIWGKGVITYARESVGFGIATERHGATFFGSGGQPRGVLVTPGMRDPDARRSMREEWKQVHGSPDSGEIAILPDGSKFEPISITNEDSQFLETRKFNVNEIARWYKVPPHLLGDLERATFTNIEAQGIEFVTYSLTPWLRKWEDELERKLLTEEERAEYFIRHDFSALLRGDFKARMDAFSVGILNGIYTLNQACRLENLPGIGPAGDQNFVQLNLTTAERMLKGPPEQTAIKPPESKPLKPAAREVLADALNRMLSKEANAVRRFVKDAEFETRLTEFHAKHLPCIEEAVAPACRLLAMLGIERSPREIAVEVAAHSREALLTAYNTLTHEQLGALLDSWAQMRTKQETDFFFQEGE